MMKTRDHLFALAVHGGIIFAIAILITVSSCQPAAPPPPEPDPVASFFKEIQTTMDDEAAESVTVIGVDDNTGRNENLKRQIFQEIQAQLHALGSFSIIEQPTSVLEAKFTELGITPSSGISPDDAKQLARELNADVLLYASIESSAPDVHIKLYSAETGSVIFAETLQAWPLPVSRDKEEDLTGLFGDEGTGGTGTGTTPSDQPVSGTGG
jgi:hypothetical protein